MMKICKFIFLLFFIFFSKKGITVNINEKISEKYDDIFSTNLLSFEDVKNYQEIFKLQNNCKWKNANKLILKIKNKVLMGHVLAERYLHPICYRSEFLELTFWLKRYNDHPQAKRIYRLAVKRMPKGYKSPNKPIKPIGVIKQSLDLKSKNLKYKSNKKLSKSQKTEKQKLINGIKSRVNSGWPSGAAKLLKQKYVYTLLDQVEVDQQKELISKGYFLANAIDNPKINELAIKYAEEALNDSSLYVPYAGWTAGLASWRLGRYKEAAEYFSNFSISLKDNVWHQASGSFWAARAYAKLNKYEEINFWLNRAAKNPNSFYGLLACNILGIKSPIDWKIDQFNPDKKIKLLNLPSSKRVQALIQVGLPFQLENEIIYMNSVLNIDVAKWSLQVAQHFNLAHTQLKIVNKLQRYGVNLPIKYSYPTPIWEPENGFRLQPEIMYAFMHQESMFNKNAKSYRGALGLMQVMPSTARFISTNKEIKKNNENILKNPELNLEVGQEYIEYLLKLDSINNNLIYLTAAYNGGPGNLQKWKKNIDYLNDPLFFMESIPSRETRWFIEKVLTKYWIYQSKNGIVSSSLKFLAEGKNPIY